MPLADVPVLHEGINAVPSLYARIFGQTGLAYGRLYICS